MYKHGGSYNGQISREQAYRLRHNQEFLVETLRSKDIVEPLLARGVLNAYDKFSILTQQTSNRDSNKKLVEVMFHKAPQGFDVFLEVLLHTGHTEAHERLSSTEVPADLDDDDSVLLAACAAYDSDAAIAGDNLPRNMSTASANPSGSEAPGRSPASSTFPQLASSGANMYQPESPGDTMERGRTEQLSAQMTTLSTRVDKLADSVEHMQTRMRVMETRKEEERRREAKLMELEQSLRSKDDQLARATSQIQDLYSKIGQMERVKSQALTEATQEIQKVNQDLQKQYEENKRLEETVKELTAEKEELKKEIQKLTKEKVAVQRDLRTQASKIKALESENQQLQDKLSRSDQKLDFFIHKVEKIEMRVDTPQNKKKQKRTRVCAPKRSAPPSVPQPVSAHARAHDNMQDKSSTVPTKEAVAKANSKKC